MRFGSPDFRFRKDSNRFGGICAGVQQTEMQRRAKKDALQVVPVRIARGSPLFAPANLLPAICRPRPRDGRAAHRIRSPRRLGLDRYLEAKRELLLRPADIVLCTVLTGLRQTATENSSSRLPSGRPAQSLTAVTCAESTDQFSNSAQAKKANIVFPPLWPLRGAHGSTCHKRSSDSAMAGKLTLGRGRRSFWIPG